MKRLILLIIILSAVSLIDLPAQRRKAERAYASFKAGEYYEAIDLFKDAYSKAKRSDRETRAELGYMIAEAYRLTNDPRNAETWYRLAVRSSVSRPEAQFWLASSLKKNGRYPQAVEEFRKYKQIAPSDPKADQELRACELALEWQKNPEAYRVEELKDLNSGDSDFSPAYDATISVLFSLPHHVTMQQVTRPTEQQDRVLPIFLKAVLTRNQSGALLSLSLN